MHFSPFVIAAKAATGITAVGEEASSGLTAKIGDFFQFFFTKLPAWIAGFIILGVSIGLARMVRSIVENKISSRVDEEHQEMVVLGGRIAYVTTLAVGITTALKIAGIDLTTILAAIAFGIGFALRDLIMNFIAGMYILLSRHFTIGDFIKVGTVTGKIVEIQSRATILKSIDGTKIVVPNADLFSQSVVSYTSNPMRRVVVPLYVAYGTDLDFALETALSTIKNHPKILKKPGPSVIIKDYGDSSIDLVARFWVMSKDGWVKVRSEMIRNFDKAFSGAGIRVPYNTFHLETKGDVIEEEKIENAAEKAVKEKIGLTPFGNDGATVATVPIVSGPTQALEPEGSYVDQTEIDEQTIDNHG